MHGMVSNDVRLVRNFYFRTDRLISRHSGASNVKIFVVGSSASANENISRRSLCTAQAQTKNTLAPYIQISNS